MKYKRLILLLSIAGLLFIIPFCIEQKMMVETGEVTEILINSAKVSGTVIDVGEGATQHGHCYGTAAGPTVSGTKTALGIAVPGEYTSSLTGLEPSTKYYVRAYTSLGAETTYGSEINFTTASAALPELTTTAITSITKSSAVSGGNISTEGGTSVTARGVCWNVASGPTIDDSKTSNGTGSGAFASSITGLTANTVYYVRAYATNAGGTAYGNEISFTTSPEVAVAPSVTTAEVTSVTSNSAISGGEVTSEGGAPVTAKGVCWSTTANPTITSSKTTDGTGSGNFVSNLTNLNPGTTYYVRAYATNSAGTSYGNEYNFTTEIVIPTISTITITSITSTTAASGGNITKDGGSAVTVRGVCWSTSQNPTVDDNHTSDGLGIGTYPSNLSGLTENTTYYVRAYATNNAGTAYGNELSFKTGAVVPTLTTTAVTSITSTTATSGGDITSDGGSSVTAKGVCWSTSPNPTTVNSHTTDGSGSGSFVSNLTDLNPGTKYYVRAYATNSAGTSYATNELSFTTGVDVPILITITINSVTDVSAGSGGNITSDGGSSVTTRGVCWSTSPGPTIANSRTYDGTGTGVFTSSITGMTSNTVYYVRAYATNSGGTAYGNEISFTTLAALSTTSILSINTATASSGGTITAGGGANIIARGVCWSTSPNPAISNDKTSDGTGTGSFTSNLTGLTSNTIYYFRAYATNDGGTSYGDQQSFTTLALVTTSSVTNVTSSSASCGGYIEIGGGATITQKGVCWSTSENPTIIDNKTLNGSGPGMFTSSLTGLTPCITYYVRAYATNGGGTSYGDDISFTTVTILPNVATTNISNITSINASSGGNVTGDCASEVTARGVCCNTSGTPTITDSKTVDDSGPGSFVSNLTGLTSNTLYYVRAYATNSAGTIYGSEVSFTTLAEVSTAAITDISAFTASGGGSISNGGGQNITARGICWSTSTNPTVTNNKTTDGTGIGSFISSITGLTSNTQYYVRAYATNGGGTAYGNEQNFTTDPEPITDIDGNIYNVVVIGTQKWMKENLKTTKYNNGASIAQVTGNSEWSNLITQGYCWYNNDEATYKNTYGALYNWYAVNSGLLCPTGWHVPTDADWTILTDYLGGLTLAGQHLKETGTTHWSSPNTFATNSTRFTALPGGMRDYYSGVFYDLHDAGYWWSATTSGPDVAWTMALYYLYSPIFRNDQSYRSGFSVRCIKN